MSSAIEQIQQAEAHKEDGNKHFGGGSYKKALGAYHKVFLYLNGLQAPPDAGNSSDGGTSAPLPASSTQIPQERVKDVNKLKQSTRLNMAACYLKLEEYQKCVDACGKALEFGDSAKAYFRRAQAFAEQRNFSGATTDLERARALAPDDAAIASELRKVRAAFKQGDSNERQQAARMLAGAPLDPRAQKIEDAASKAADEAHSGPVVEEVTEDVSQGPAASNGPASSSNCPVDVAPSTAKASDGGAPSSGGGGYADVPAECASAGDAAAAQDAPVARVVQPVNAGEAQDEARKPDMAVRELTYSWHQTNEDVKIYISFDQSDELRNGVDESCVQVEYGEWSVLLVIKNNEGRVPLGLRLGDFHRRIAPESCRCTVRSSRITLKLVKQVQEHWWNLLQSVPLSATS